VGEDISFFKTIHVVGWNERIGGCMELITNPEELGI